MFELLKKKISSFAEKLKKTVEKKEGETQKAKQAEPSAELPEQEIEEKKSFAKEEIEKPEEKAEKIKLEEELIPEELEEEIEKKELAVEEIEEKPMVEEKKRLTEEEKILEEAEEEVLREEKPKTPKEKLKKIEIPKKHKEEIESEKKTKIPEEKEFVEEEPPAKPFFEEKKRELKAKIGITDKLKRFFKAEIAIEEKDLKELLEELDFSLLEADVEQNTAEKIIFEMRKRLTGKKILGKQKIDLEIKKEIREILLEIMKTEQIDLLERIKKAKPFKILFLGPNGAGKTTSIAKLTKFLQNNKLKVIWAASDTFRAASIEQLEKHSEKLGIRVVKHTYGADPAAVAFDAVKAAEAGKIDVVLIDSAGRQETNKNLMEELKKIVRVIKPDLKIYVGESFTGQALLQQATEYEKNIGIDGFILTKIDCDAKGGTTISLIYNLKKPILFVGTGQEYKDLQEFKPEFVINKIL